MGGIQPKLLAAIEAGVKTVILPAENEQDVRHLPLPGPFRPKGAALVSSTPGKDTRRIAPFRASPPSANPTNSRRPHSEPLIRPIRPAPAAGPSRRRLPTSRGGLTFRPSSSRIG